MVKDTDVAVHIVGFGPAGVSSAGVIAGCLSVPVRNALVTLAYYTEGYSPVLTSEDNLLEPLPAVSSALGGYM